MATPVSNVDDVIDSRDIIERIGDLEGRDERDDDEQEELDTLIKLREQVEPYCPDWTDGATLIRHSYFVDYIEELIDDCYDMPEGMKAGAWPWRHMKLNYEAAAQEAEQDYTAVDFDGVEYLVR